MNLSKYTTQELEFIIFHVYFFEYVFITSHVEFFEKELEKRYIAEFDDFLFKVGDVIHSKSDNDNFLLKIKEIDKRNSNVVADVIIIRDNECQLFDAYVDEWYDIVTTEWNEYVKIEDSALFENLLKIIDKYNDDVQQLNDDAYLKLKNEIAPYDR